jgi:hypothetical protein
LWLGLGRAIDLWRDDLGIIFELGLGLSLIEGKQLEVFSRVPLRGGGGVRRDFHKPRLVRRPGRTHANHNSAISFEEDFSV